jgi:hypothetical protein
MSFKFLKTNSQNLETGLETPHPVFLEIITKNIFYKNSMYLIRPSSNNSVIFGLC